MSPALAPWPLLATFLTAGAGLLALLVALLLLRGRRACLQQRTIEVPLGVEAALDRCMAALLRLSGGAHVPKVQAAGRRIDAVVGFTFWSLGERVSVAAEPLAARRTRLHVQSWSRLGTTLVDWGKNQRNVEQLVAALHEPAAAAEAIALASRPGGVARCPYCRSDLDPAEAVACVTCLARHHADCWEEHGECAACRGVERFAGIERTPRAPAREPRRALDKG